jgi:hypothetical protein
VLARLVTHGALRARHPCIHVIHEERTTGELVTELADAKLTDDDRCARLHGLVPEIRERIEAGDFVILERFHLTFYALMPRWELVSAIDDELAALGFASVLLDVPDARLRERSFVRPELEASAWSEGLVAWYGSEALALDAFARSQGHRRSAISSSKLSTVVVDTSAKDWDRIADAVVDSCLAG